MGLGRGLGDDFGICTVRADGGIRSWIDVVHVAQEADYSVTFVAADFATFIRGLVSDEFDDREDACETDDDG